jgi:hypothetical protein
LMILTACTTGVVACCWTKATSLAGIIILSLAFGFSSGVSYQSTVKSEEHYIKSIQGVISLQSTCGAQLVTPENYGIVMGSIVTFVSIP